MTEMRVAGERADTLLEALGRIEWSDAPDGMRCGSFRLEPRLGDPFLRALMRVEAELLLADASRLGRDDYEERTHEQRAADAFVALTLRVVAAIRGIAVMAHASHLVVLRHRDHDVLR